MQRLCIYLYRRCGANIFIQTLQCKSIYTDVAMQIYLYRRCNANLFVETLRCNVFAYIYTDVAVQIYLYRRCGANLFIQTLRCKSIYTDVAPQRLYIICISSAKLALRTNWNAPAIEPQICSSVSTSRPRSKLINLSASISNSLSK